MFIALFKCCTLPWLCFLSDLMTKIVPVWIFSQDAKNVPKSTYHCSFQQKWTLEAGKQWALVIIFVHSYDIFIQLHIFHFLDKTRLLWSLRQHGLGAESLGTNPVKNTTHDERAERSKNKLKWLVCDVTFTFVHTVG